MIRGRKPLPESLRLVTNTTQKLPKKPGKSVGNEPETPLYELENLARPHPEWFSPAHIVEWNYILTNATPDLLKTVDYNTLVMHVTAVVAHADAATMLRTSPMLVLTPNDHQQASPYFSIMNRQAEIVVRTAAEMGLTPSSRTRVAVSGNKKPKTKADPTKEFFG